MTLGAGNDGIWIGGQAQVSAGAMAAGPGAHAEGTQYSLAAAPASLDELRAALAALVAELKSGPPGVSDPDSLAEVAASAEREAGKSRPDKGILSGLLHALMAGVTNSAVLVNAVVAIQHAVSSLL